MAAPRGDAAECGLRGAPVEVEVEVGAAVEVRGLVRAAEHNGARAVVLEFLPARGRYALRLAAGGQRIVARRENFVLLRGEFHRACPKFGPISSGL